MTTIKSYAAVVQETLTSLGELGQLELVLEEKLANHKNLVAGLVGNIEWLKANGNMNTSTIEIVEEKQVAELVEHEGLMLKKVEREAKAGDYVKFFGLGFKCTCDDEFYKVYSDEKGPFIRNDVGAVENVYGWLSVVVEVYEVFSELPFLPQSVDVVEEPYAVFALTNTAKRVQAIQKAKKFIEETEAFNSTDVDFKYIINREKRTVVALVVVPETKSVILRGIAKCHPGDTFNAHIGKAIALNRLLVFKNEISDIEGAPNPDEVVKGQIVKALPDTTFHEKEFTVYQVSDTKVYDIPLCGWIYRDVAIILDDTNAEYEVSK